ncbi:MAG TPA: quinone oxidoreductase [Arthrobacter sp.]|nr:quinone oxidoreductase [Arthrobacter sp.]
MRSIIVPRTGGPEVYAIEDTERPLPGSGQVAVDLSVSGVNYLDATQRKGATPLAPPFAAGVEGAGTITRIGEGVEGFAIGQRVGWLAGGQGSFSDAVAVEADKLVALPDDIDDETAVAALMQGITAHYLTTDTYPIKQGDRVLVHAAAGGLGQLLVQLAAQTGATVYGTVSTAEKAGIARSRGAEQVLGYGDFADRIHELTGGEGVGVVYDGIGADTFEGSLAALGIRGMLVCLGNASGPTPPLDIASLNSGGSLYVTRPTVAHHIRTPGELRRRAEDVFGWIRAGRLSVSIGQRYPVEQVATAFRELESRRTVGKTLLLHHP